MHTHPAGIILAGVHQWRASAFERWTPRTLVPIANRPLVEYPLSWLREGGAQSVRICANSDTGALRSYLGDGSKHGLPISYYEDQMPRGPAGCIADAARELEGDHVLVAEGCIIPQPTEVDRLIQEHVACGAALTVAVSGTDAATDHLAPAGLYVFSRVALDHVGASGYEDIKEMLIPRLYDRGETVGKYNLEEAPLRVTGANSCFLANRRILRHLQETNTTPTGYERCGNAFVHESALVAADARLEGAVLVGPSACVRSRATIVGPTTIGAGGIVESDAVVCRSIAWDRAHIAAAAFVDRCILTYGAFVEPGRWSTGRIHHGGVASV